MTTYYLEIECSGVVPNEDWIKLFKIIKHDIIGAEQLIRIECGTVDEDGIDSRDIDLL